MAELPGRYEEVSKLAGGGMSETALCIDSNLNRRVVFKALKPGVSQARILDELAALSAIRSDNVVQIFDVVRGKDGAVVGLIEEFIDGSDLDFSPVANFEDAIKMLYSIASGVADIHAHNRVHRDLKPENMKIDKSGMLKIFDFGLAKLQDSAGTKVFYYTPGFTAPEAFVKNPAGLHEYDFGVDVFAFGAIAFWLANKGQLPPELYQAPAALPDGGVRFGTAQFPPPPALATLLDRTMGIAAQRPAIEEVRLALKSEILRGSHRMLLTFSGKDYILDHSNPASALMSNGSGISIDYNGVGFEITKVSGTVEINNMTPAVGSQIAGSVVIVLGTGGDRVFITADVSHPEVAR